MTPDHTPSLLRSFERHLRAENRSDNTIESYLESIRQAEAFLVGHGRTLLDARRADLEDFLGDLLKRRAPATAATRYKVVRMLYAWLEEEEEIIAGPMARMRPPIVPEQPVPSPSSPRTADVGCWPPAPASTSKVTATGFPGRPTPAGPRPCSSAPSTACKPREVAVSDRHRLSEPQARAQARAWLEQQHTDAHELLVTLLHYVPEPDRTRALRELSTGELRHLARLPRRTDQILDLCAAYTGQRRRPATPLEGHPARS